ncbi:hypothetical protein OAS74_00250 [bacterium]|nr:hypothetical protein [bacterium]
MVRMVAHIVPPGQRGSDLIALKLSEIIFTQVILHYLAGAGRHREGLAGFANPHISQALEAIHQDPETPWSVWRAKPGCPGLPFPTGSMS